MMNVNDEVYNAVQKWLWSFAVIVTALTWQAEGIKMTSPRLRPEFVIFRIRMWFHNAEMAKAKCSCRLPQDVCYSVNLIQSPL
jgi:hypothetical protein